MTGAATVQVLTAHHHHYCEDCESEWPCNAMDCRAPDDYRCSPCFHARVERDCQIQRDRQQTKDDELLCVVVMVGTLVAAAVAWMVVG